MKYFSIKELCKSNTAIRLKINNTPSKDIELRLTSFIEEVLDPIREKYGKPISVSSGYRCEALNKAVGGAKSSFHLKGCAADLYCKTNAQTKEVFNVAKQLGKYTELFYERSGSSIWVHIAYDPSSKKKVINDNFIVK